MLREADDELELFDVLETVLFPCMPGPGGGIRFASSTELLDLVADGLIGATGKAEKLRVDWNYLTVSFTNSYIMWLAETYRAQAAHLLHTVDRASQARLFGRAIGRLALWRHAELLPCHKYTLLMMQH